LGYWSRYGNPDNNFFLPGTAIEVSGGEEWRGEERRGENRLTCDDCSYDEATAKINAYVVWTKEEVRQLE